MRLVRRIFVGFFLLLIVLVVVTAISIYQYSLRKPAARADAAIVLGAAVWNGRPSPVFEERINHAVNLHHSGTVDYIIFTGGVGHNDRLSESEVGKKMAIAAGVNPERILIESESKFTIDNIRNARELAAERGLSTFLLVSDPFHMKRAVTMARDLELTAYPSPTPTSRYVTWRSKFPFLLQESYFYLTYEIRKLVHNGLDIFRFGDAGNR